MPEAGGPTTQSGILYQNTIAALYLGRLCEIGATPPHQQVVEVRCEAPTYVDDVIVVFGDGHRQFIQAKEALDPAGTIWEDLWRHFAREASDAAFRPAHDRLSLFIGDARHEWRSLRGIAERAEGSTCFAEWHDRLSQQQRRLLAKIQPVLHAEGFGPEEVHALLSCVHIRQEPLEDLEYRAYREIPSSSARPITLFRLLRDRVGHHARLRKPFRREALLESLQDEHNITFDLPLPAPAPYRQSPPTFVPEDSSPLRWFVSSRLKDDCLRAERDAAISAIAQSRIIVPWAWEHVPAGNYPYEECCLHSAAKSDGLVLILEGEVSLFCRKEYEAAADAKKPCYIFIKDGRDLTPQTQRFLEEQRRRGNNPNYFRSATELESLLGRSLEQECVRAFRLSQHFIPSAHPVQARLR